MIYYLVLFYDQEVFWGIVVNEVDFLLVIDLFCKEVISLLMYSELDEDILVYIIVKVKEFFVK